MSTELNEEEVQKEYTETMGLELGTVYLALWNECVSLHYEWEEFESLFGESEERILLLNKSAPSFFRLVQDILLESVLLRISRLTDNAASGGGGKKDNLSVHRLPSMVGDPIRGKIEVLSKVCSEKCEFAQKWRNRRIAHRDLSLALEQKSAEPLPLANRELINDAVTSISALLNEVDRHYRGFTTCYDLGIRPLGNTSCLIRVLQAGIRAQEERHLHRSSATEKELPE